MSDNSQSLRNPETISSLNELEVARRKAEINASHDRLLLSNNLTALRSEGPSVVLRNVVLPVLGVGVAIWGVSKVVGALTSPDERNYYVEPYDDEVDRYEDATSSGVKGRTGRKRRYPSYTEPVSKMPSGVDIAKYLPAALIIAKMGVGYWEKSGRRVPQIVHDLLAGPGVSSSQAK